MASKRKVEVFTAECTVCEQTVELVRKVACPSCEVIIYDLREGCITNECRDKVKLYRITRLPAVVVNGNLLDCCKIGPVSENDLRAVSAGTA
ncbi:MAG: glutaredoxin [Thermodesulfobacteriota bacterium]